MVTKCKSHNADGEPCGATLYRQSEWCYWHHPDLEERRKESRAKGGKNRSNEHRAKKELRRYEDAELIAILSSVLGGLLQGKYEPGVATAAATVARTITQIRTSTELVARIEELESMMAVKPSSNVRRLV